MPNTPLAFEPSNQFIAATKVAYIYRVDSRAHIPTKATDGSAGYDLYSIEDYTLYPGTTIKARTGLVVKPPTGYFSTIRARSGLGSKYNIGIPHGVGTIDSDYSKRDDELIVVLHRGVNFDNALEPRYEAPYQIKAGDRIAQLLFERQENIRIIDGSLEDLEDGGRGGFGHSGR